MVIERYGYQRANTIPVIANAVPRVHLVSKNLHYLSFVNFF